MQNDKIFCLSHSISQEWYIIWLSFTVRMCKMIISPGVFFNFKILIFCVVRGLKGKIWPKMTKFFACRTLYFRNHIIIWSSFMVYMYAWEDNISRHFFHFFVFFFFKILIFGIIRGVVKWQKMIQNDKNFHQSYSISQESYIIWLWFLVYMCKILILGFFLGG